MKSKLTETVIENQGFQFVERKSIIPSRKGLSIEDRRESTHAPTEIQEKTESEFRVGPGGSIFNMKRKSNKLRKFNKKKKRNSLNPP